MKIFLDAGHSVGRGDAGAEGFNLKEQDITFGLNIYFLIKLCTIRISLGKEQSSSHAFINHENKQLNILCLHYTLQIIYLQIHSLN